MFVNFNDIALLRQKLSLLKGDETPAFGLMSPQHMIEHLSHTMDISCGKAEVPFSSPAGKIPGLLKFLRSDKPLPEGFKAPFLPKEKTLDLIHSNINEATEELVEQIIKFFQYFEEHPEAIHVHPVFGSLSKEDWIIFHKKHFTHHFRQFNVL